MTQISIQLVSFASATANIQADIQNIRQIVFQNEQAVDPAIDFDGLDAAAQHIVVYADEQPIGTARIRYLSNQLAKIERVAVLSAYRGQGIGTQIMRAAIDFLDKQNIAESKVHAQSQAVSFYQKLGFYPQGDIFYEAGIPHIAMKRIRPVSTETNK